MKIRIKGNSLRIRLSQSEITDFGSLGSITDTISFSPVPGNSLRYSIVAAGKQKIGAQFKGNHIKILIPEALAKEWVESNRVSLSESKKIGNDETLSILIEKDFQCLHKRPGEDEMDNFPNPLADQKID
jgi:hypothetical protein